MVPIQDMIIWSLFQWCEKVLPVLKSSPVSNLSFFYYTRATDCGTSVYIKMAYQIFYGHSFTLHSRSLLKCVLIGSTTWKSGRDLVLLLSAASVKAEQCPDSVPPICKVEACEGQHLLLIYMCSSLEWPFIVHTISISHSELDEDINT